MKIEDVQIGQFGIARGSWPADCVVFPSQRKLVSVDRHFMITSVDTSDNTVWLDGAGEPHATGAAAVLRQLALGRKGARDAELGAVGTVGGVAVGAGSGAPFGLPCVSGARAVSDS